MHIYCGSSNVLLSDNSRITCEETPIEIRKKLSESTNETIELTISKTFGYELKQFSKKSIKSISWAD